MDFLTQIGIFKDEDLESNNKNQTFIEKRYLE